MIAFKKTEIDERVNERKRVRARVVSKVRSWEQSESINKEACMQKDRILKKDDMCAREVMWVSMRWQSNNTFVSESEKFYTKIEDDSDPASMAV